MSTSLLWAQTAVELCLQQEWGHRGDEEGMSLHVEITAQGCRGLEQQICQFALPSLEGSQ